MQTANEFIPSRTVIWAAGVRAVPLLNTLGVKQDRAGRVVVNPDLTVEGAPGVYVIGDCASFAVEGGILPGVAQVAIQQGRHAARNLLARHAGKPQTEFKYFDKGSMATLGRNRAIAYSAGFKLSGFIAWLAWAFIHVLYLVSFRSRIAVLMEWAWAYFSYNRSARIILDAAIALPGRDTKATPAAASTPALAAAPPKPMDGDAMLGGTAVHVAAEASQ